MRSSRARALEPSLLPEVEPPCQKLSPPGRLRAYWYTCYGGDAVQSHAVWLPDNTSMGVALPPKAHRAHCVRES